jgi:hypothetical protein
MTDQFRTLRDFLPPTNEDQEADRGNAAMLRLRQAYGNLRGARVTPEDIDLILVDLAKASGYYNTTPPGVDAMTLAYCEGQRSIFGRIQRFMNPPYGEMEELQRAVGAEMVRDAETGREIS